MVVLGGGAVSYERGTPVKVDPFCPAPIHVSHVSLTPSHRVSGTRSGGRERQSYLTKCIYQLALEIHLPHKIVNLLFTITNSNTKLTVLWGS